MRSDARLIAAVLLFAAALMGQGGGLNLPPGAILLSTAIPCPFGTTEYSRAAGRLLMPISSSAGAAAVAAATARTSGAPYGPSEAARLHGSVRTAFIRFGSSAGAGYSSVFIFHGSSPSGLDPHPVNDPPFIRVVACVVD